MRSHTEWMQDLVKKYQESGAAWPASPKTIARWALDNKLWAPPPASLVNQCADQLSRAMRDEYFTDPQGRRVRAKHAVVTHQEGEQYVLWDDIRTATPAHMRLAFQQRRQQILGDCRQLKSDVDSYNDNRNQLSPIQMVFDFTLDLEEMELARKAV